MHGLTNPNKKKAKSFSITQEIFRILRNPKVHYRIHKSPSLPLVLRHTNPVHALSFYSLRSIITLQSHLRLGIPSGRFLSDFLINTHHAFLFFLAPQYHYRLNSRYLMSISRLRCSFEVPVTCFRTLRTGQILKAQSILELTACLPLCWLRKCREFYTKHSCPLISGVSHQ
jgi:hypothetical protein